MDGYSHFEMNEKMEVSAKLILISAERNTSFESLPGYLICEQW